MWVARQLDDSKIKYDAQSSDVKEINDALQSASKRGTGNAGYPEYVAVVKDFVIVIEDKANLAKHQKLTDTGILSIGQKDIADYAKNGAYFYAKHIAQNSSFHKIFAIGVSGDEKHHKITPLYVDDREGYKQLPDIESFTSFTASNIDEYYTCYVLAEKTDVEKTTEEILKDAAELHEYLRTYGSLKDQDKGQKMTGWLTIGENTYYLGEDGVMQTGWVTIDGKEYYFNYEGEMLKGLQEIQMKTYLFDNNGVKLTGWQQWEGQKYYLGTDGVMYMEQWVDGTMATDWEWTGEKMEYFDENGRYVPERPWEGWSVVGGETYYYQYGDYVTGWQKIEKQQYYFASDGHMVKDRWVPLEEKWYYFGNNGVMMKKQWKQIAGKWYYFEDNGVMVKNQWKQIGKTWYSFNKDGQMRASCWVGDYYVKADGAMATNQMVGTYYVGNDGKWVKNRWVLLEEKWYYFGNNGVMVKNQWKQIGKTWYSFNKDGQMRAGCWGGDYYVKADGAMATNQWIGKYYVGNDGKWVKGKTKTA